MIFDIPHFMGIAHQHFVSAQEVEALPVVQAVLFYSPTCPHCHQVINEILIPLQEVHGEQLQILALETQAEPGAQLYQAAVDYYEIPDNRLGVPTLIVADKILVGSVEAEQFRDIVADGLAGNGIPWPTLPALHLLFPDLPKTAVSAPDSELVESDEPVVETVTAVTADEAVDEAEPETAVIVSPESDFGLDPESAPNFAVAGDEVPVTVDIDPPADPVGIAIGWLVLLFMMVASGYVISLFLRKHANPDAILTHWSIPGLALVGLVAALYLSYVEITHVEAICGPVGECNIVQSSTYAQILGIPVAVLGVINYIIIVALWFWQRNGRLQGRRFVIWSLMGMTAAGTLFSIYLTVVELFVIHAVCAWCLSSALVTTLLMLIVVLSVTHFVPVGEQRYA